MLLSKPVNTQFLLFLCYYKLNSPSTTLRIAFFVFQCIFQGWQSDKNNGGFCIYDPNNVLQVRNFGY